MKIISRAEWGAAPPKKVTYFPAPPVGLVSHYVGAKGPMFVESLEKAKRTMRALQADAFAKGYADFEYNFAIAQTGDVLEGRGRDIQSGANGDQTQNRKRWSVVFLVGVGEPLSVAAIATYHELRAWLGGDQVQHCKVAPLGTACPGDAIKGQWSQLVGTFTTTPPPTPGPSTTTPLPTFPPPKGKNVATLQRDNHIWRYGVTSDGKLHHDYWDGSAWHHYEIGAGCDPHAQIDAIFWPESSTDTQVFAPTLDGRVFHAWWFAPEVRFKTEYFYS